MIRSTTAVIAAFFLVAPVLTAPSVSSAKKGGDKHAKTELTAHLAPCCGEPEPDARGEAERKTVSKSSTVRSDRFTAEIKIPVPSTGLGITDPTTADVRLVLSRADTDYAECSLRLDDFEAEGDDDSGGDGAAQAEFQLKVQLTNKNGTPVTRQIKGQCDVDLATDDVQPGLPDVEAGDVATAIVVDAATSTRTPFLEGTFVQD